MQDKYIELTSDIILVSRFADILQKNIIELRSIESAHEHGESPTLGAVLEELEHKNQLKIDQVIGGLPVWKILLQTG